MKEDNTGCASTRMLLRQKKLQEMKELIRTRSSLDYAFREMFSWRTTAEGFDYWGKVTNYSWIAMEVMIDEKL